MRRTFAVVALALAVALCACQEPGGEAGPVWIAIEANWFAQTACGCKSARCADDTERVFQGWLALHYDEPAPTPRQARALAGATQSLVTCVAMVEGRYATHR